MKFYVQFEQSEIFRGAQGRWIDASGRVTGLYYQFADELLDEVTSIIRSERSVRDKNPFGRPPKGNLAEVTSNRAQNRNASNRGFEVGIKSYLEKSDAKYYRIIEEGTAVAAPNYTETMIDGWWRGDRPTGYIKPYPPELIEHGLPRKGIKPLHAYRRAWDNLDGNRRMNEIWRQMLVDAGMAATRGPLAKGLRIQGNLKFDARF